VIFASSTHVRRGPSCDTDVQHELKFPCLQLYAYHSLHPESTSLPSCLARKHRLHVRNRVTAKTASPSTSQSLRGILTMGLHCKDARPLQLKVLRPHLSSSP
ncbi:unnamed protein product, partial [Ectocarpus sp. 12 AP-2014]